MHAGAGSLSFYRERRAQVIRSPALFISPLLLSVAVLGTGAGCAKTPQIAAVQSCETTTGSPWVPNISGAGDSNHDSTVTVTQEVLSTTGPLLGIVQAAPASKEISVSINMTQDLGTFGSLTLVAEPTDFPAGKVGNAYPMLVSLSDGTNEFIHLARAGTVGDCAEKGYFLYDSVNDVVTSNPDCSISAPSAYVNADKWTDHQLPAFGYATVNSFPTCNWGGGSGTAQLPSCSFNSDFFVGGKLRSGVTYTAKYILMASNYLTVASGTTAGLKVTAIKKRSTRGAVGGAVDVNVILVGSSNVAQSRTVQGQRNLDTLFGLVQDNLAQASSGVRLGVVRVYEWGCAEGGDVFSTASLNSPTDPNYIGKMFSSGSSMVSSAATEGKTLNIFLVSSISLTSDNSLLKVAGLSGGVGGPPVDGLETSGLAFASNNKIGIFNALCSTTPCPLTTQDPAFYDMGATIAHEVGHYLGLNHPSESNGTIHDPVLDTPVCTQKEPLGSENLLTANSCFQDNNVDPVSGLKCSAVCPGYDPDGGVFCETESECQFNHLMWWFAKDFSQSLGRGDGNILSPQSGTSINYNSFVQ